MDDDDLVLYLYLEGLHVYTSLFLSSNTGKTTEVMTALMAATAENETIIGGMEIVLAAIETGVVDMAETADPMTVDPVIATAEIALAVIATGVIATAEIASVEIVTAVIATVVIDTVVIAIGVVDMAETVTMIVATMIAEVVTVLVREIGDATMMTVNVSEVGVTVEMQEAILIETRGNQVRPRLETYRYIGCVPLTPNFRKFW